MELRLKLDDDFIKKLKTRTGTKSTNKILKEALTILDWASENASQNRVLMSVNEDGTNPTRIESRLLRQSRPKKPKRKK